MSSNINWIISAFPVSILEDIEVKSVNYDVIYCGKYNQQHHRKIRDTILTGIIAKVHTALFKFFNPLLQFQYYGRLGAIFGTAVYWNLFLIQLYFFQDSYVSTFFGHFFIWFAIYAGFYSSDGRTRSSSNICVAILHTPFLLLLLAIGKNQAFFHMTT